jgi:hypothetical protein
LNKKIFFPAITAIFILAFSSGSRDDPKLAQLLLQMFDSIKNIKTLRVNISAIERVESNYLSAKSEIKLQTKPRKLYFINRSKKLEVLFNQELYGSKALVKTHVFPYLTVMLDPTGNIMRKNQHYTINELGYEFIGQSVALTINKDKKGLDNFVYRGKYNKNGYQCHLVEYENKSYNYSVYRVKEKETVSLIAAQLGVNDYLLRYKNDLLNEFGYMKNGTTLTVPTLYCQKAVIYIDMKMMLPVAISLYDDAGLFESYEFTGIAINKHISDEEFKKDYKAYGF